MNNNPNSKSPLDEIKRITKESAPANQRRKTATPPLPQAPAAAPKVPAPAKPKRPAPMPDSDAAPVKSGSTPAQKPVAPPPRVPTAQSNVEKLTAEEIAKLNSQSVSKGKEIKSVQNPENSKTKVSEPVVEPKAIEEKKRNNTMKAENKAHNKKAAKQPKSKAAQGGKDSTGGGTVLSNSVKAIIYIVSVLVVSGCLSLFVIFVGNDCFAFVKPDTEVEVIIPDDADLDDIAKILHDNDIINYPSMFKLYVNIRNKGTDNYLSGKFTVKAAMSYDTLIAKFKPYSTREEVTITIVEGSTTQDIIDLFVGQGIGTQEGFEKAINEYEYDFWFLEDLTEEKTANRIYRLDGYLFPDTYNFFTDAREEEIIYKLLDNFDKKFDKDNIARLEELGMSLDEIVIIASMIQSEAKYVNNNPHADNGSDYALVSAVFHNRLNNPNYDGIGGKLQSDATVKYVIDYYGEDIELADALKSYDSPYNTYLYEGLPAGPISNPSLNAINFAMNPDMISGKNYYYFISNSQGYNYYATTATEHAKNVAKVKEETESAE